MISYIKYEGQIYKAIDSTPLETELKRICKGFIDRCKNLYICHLRNTYADLIEGSIETYSGQFNSENELKEKLLCMCGKDFSLTQFKLISKERRQQGFTCKVSVKFVISNALYSIMEKKYVVERFRKAL